jgi:hypothetical protein
VLDDGSFSQGVTTTVDRFVAFFWYDANNYLKAHLSTDYRPSTGESNYTIRFEGKENGVGFSVTLPIYYISYINLSEDT